MAGRVSLTTHANASPLTVRYGPDLCTAVPGSSDKACKAPGSEPKSDRLQANSCSSRGPVQIGYGSRHPTPDNVSKRSAIQTTHALGGRADLRDDQPQELLRLSRGGQGVASRAVNSTPPTLVGTETSVVSSSRRKSATASFGFDSRRPLQSIHQPRRRLPITRRAAVAGRAMTRHRDQCLGLAVLLAAILTVVVSKSISRQGKLGAVKGSTWRPAGAWDPPHGSMWRVREWGWRWQCLHARCCAYPASRNGRPHIHIAR
jgi:hypothetical protein